MRIAHGVRKYALRGLAVCLAAGAFLGWFAWHKLLREEPDPEFTSEMERFKYGSLGGERDAGIPYLVWLVLPRIFPEYLPGPGGYKSVGVVWEEGHDLPVGFTKKTIGFPRVGNNCALCHVSTYRETADGKPTVVVGAPAHSLNVQALLRFLMRSARDPRFTSSVVLEHIEQEVPLTWVDRQLYRFLIIPATRKGLIDEMRKFEWIDRAGVPEWGPGRDDAFNLPKYVVAELPYDGSVGQCDFGSIWNMKIRKGGNRRLNWAGETPTIRSVLLDSSFGFGVRPGANLDRRLNRLEQFLSELPPPRFPFPIDATLAATGKPIYDRYCGECHEPGGSKTNRIIPIEEIRTDRERLDSWTQAAADAFNRKMQELGFERPPLGKYDGYLSPPLDGIWARAPYLHNGSVPNLQELLEDPKRRSTVFYRGYDVYDPARIGFVSHGPEARRWGWKHDTAVRGDGNSGHVYGADLPPALKRALLEFLKTL
jgi:processive rubber oxygenase RoxA-like protein